MTTIAYKDGVIAYDSRITASTTITNDNYEKCHEVKGVKFVLCGKTSDYAKLIDAYFGGGVPGELQASALIVDAEGLWYAGRNNEDGFWKKPNRWRRALRCWKWWRSRLHCNGHGRYCI